MTAPTAARLTPEREAEIRAALKTGRKEVSYVFIGRDLLRELDAVRKELAQKDKMIAMIEASEGTRIDERDAAERDLAEARKDSARLDWMERVRPEVEIGKNECLLLYAVDVAPEWTDWTDDAARGPSLRAAIDAAMAKDGTA